MEKITFLKEKSCHIKKVSLKMRIVYTKEVL